MDKKRHITQLKHKYITHKYKLMCEAAYIQNVHP